MVLLHHYPYINSRVMASHRRIVLCLLHLLQVIAPASNCDLSSSVPLLFADEYQLFGYGSSGFYRTDGIVLLLECTFEDTGLGIVTMKIIDHSNALIASKETLRNSGNRSRILSLKRTVLNVIPGSNFSCQCVISAKQTVATRLGTNKVQVPTIQPCNSAQCEKSKEVVCYQKNGNTLANHSPFLCASDALQSIKWNNAISKNIWNKQFLNKWSQSYMHGNVLLIFYQSNNHHMGLCTDNSKIMLRLNNSGISKFHLPLEPCQVHTATIPHNIISMNESIPTTATESCAYHKFDAMPMTWNGTAIYSGTTHYIEAAEHIQLKSADGYYSNPSFYTSQTFDCTMFTWKRGSDPTKGDKMNMPPNRELATGKKFWIIKGTDLHQSNSDIIHMVGCTLTRTSTIDQASLTNGMNIRQVEFFVSQKGNVYPFYENNQFKGCFTEVDGRTVKGRSNVDYIHNKCTCVSSIYSCSPIKTKSSSVRRFPCTIPYTKPTTTTDPTWLIFLSIIALVVLCNIAVLMVIFWTQARTKEVYSSRSVTGREELPGDWSSNLIKSPVSLHTSEEISSDASE